MKKEIFNNYMKAGKIASEALQYGKGLIKNGEDMLIILKKIEDKIIDLNGKIAFPAQMSLDDCAAHFNPALKDKIILKDNLVKLDIGVHIDGYVADTALSVDLSGNNSELIKASENALNNALKIVKPGITLGEIGKTIQETIQSYGFSPVKNLSGHGLDQFQIHTAPQIPNINTKDNTELKEYDIIAIEPFATNGAGIIYNSGIANLFQLKKLKPVRDSITRQILNQIKQYKGLPFARHWLEEKFGVAKTQFALRKLMELNVLEDYQPLIDKNHGVVSQTEHSVIVMDKSIIYTKK